MGFDADVARDQAHRRGLELADAGVQAHRILALGLQRNAIEQHAAAVVHGGAVGLGAGGEYAGAVDIQLRTGVA
ncbi:hypothetical protein D3C80_1840230 [compost metagenome]